jgi:hypothetical protein
LKSNPDDILDENDLKNAYNDFRLRERRFGKR